MEASVQEVRASEPPDCQQVRALGERTYAECMNIVAGTTLFVWYFMKNVAQVFLVGGAGAVSLWVHGPRVLVLSALWTVNIMH
jgi:hypothetical protein